MFANKFLEVYTKSLIYIIKYIKIYILNDFNFTKIQQII